MATEIFIEPELMELEQPEAAQEWFEICSELGLKHQLSHADKSEEKIMFDLQEKIVRDWQKGL